MAKVDESPTNHLLITYYYLLGVSGVLLGKVLGPLEQVFFGKAGGRFFRKTGECFSEKRQAGERRRFLFFIVFLLFACVFRKKAVTLQAEII